MKTLRLITAAAIASLTIPAAASAEKIFANYQESVRHHNLFSLNIGRDRSGKLRAIDIETLRKVGEKIRANHP